MGFNSAFKGLKSESRTLLFRGPRVLSTQTENFDIGHKKLSNKRECIYLLRGELHPDNYKQDHRPTKQADLNIMKILI